jgi:hypothetical protein
MKWDSVFTASHIGLALVAVLVIMGALRRWSIDVADVGYAAIVFVACLSFPPGIELYQLGSDPVTIQALPHELSGGDRELHSAFGDNYRASLRRRHRGIVY